MKNSGICICSLLGGIVIGSVITLLVTPKTGKEMRDSIRDFVDSELDRVKCRCKDIERDIESKIQHS